MNHWQCIAAEVLLYTKESAKVLKTRGRQKFAPHVKPSRSPGIYVSYTRERFARNNAHVIYTYES